MEMKEQHSVALKKSNLTPKAITHQKFGKTACYAVEAVKEVSQTECPGLCIPQTGPCLYRCTLQLPELRVVSGTRRMQNNLQQR
ncbi:unnamed protein product [Lathyrus sativus]|nr:unnamed protein product [Lathyrus sativus]